MKLYRFFRILLRILFRILYRVKIEGREHIPKQGPVILCSNHTSLIDPPMIGAPLDRQVRYMAKAELFDIPLFGKMLLTLGAFPIKRGGVSKESIKLTLQILRQGGMLCIFPEGTRSARMSEGKKGAATFALKAGATVIPAAIIGNYRPFRRMKVIYGPAVKLDDFRQEVNADNIDRATEAIMEDIRKLLKQHQD